MTPSLPPLNIALLPIIVQAIPVEWYLRNSEVPVMLFSHNHGVHCYNHGIVARLPKKNVFMFWLNLLVFS